MPDITDVRVAFALEIPGHINDLLARPQRGPEDRAECVRCCWSAIREGVNLSEDAMLAVGLAVLKGAVAAIPGSGTVAAMVKGVLGAALEVADADSIPDAMVSVVIDAILGTFLPDAAAEIAQEELEDALGEALNSGEVEIVDFEGTALPARGRRSTCKARVVMLYRHPHVGDDDVVVPGSVVLVAHCAKTGRAGGRACRGPFAITATVGEDEDGNAVLSKVRFTDPAVR